MAKFPKISAHRGYSKKFPENTLIAFEEAVRRGADTIEFDVHFSRDKYVIVHHDYKLGRTNEGSGYVYENSWSDLRILDAGTWFASEFKDQKIPLLEEVIQKFGDTIEYEIELRGFDEEFLTAIIQLLNRHAVTDRVELTSTVSVQLLRSKLIEPRIQTGFIRPTYPDWMEKDLSDRLFISELLLSKCDVGHSSVDLLTTELVQSLKNRGFLVHVADCNTKESLLKAVTLQADQLTTNDVGLAIEVKNSKRGIR